jgi:phosphodiesterase/alkaline phosphatase D-like protein
MGLLTGENSAVLQAPIRSFRTLPRVGSFGGGVVSFGVIADLGATNDSLSTVQHMMSNEKLSMILHAGDLSYADCNSPVWDTYGERCNICPSTQCGSKP